MLTNCPLAMQPGIKSLQFFIVAFCQTPRHSLPIPSRQKRCKSSHSSADSTPQHQELTQNVEVTWVNALMQASIYESLAKDQVRFPCPPYTRAMQNRRHWSLGAKLALVATPFLLLAMVAISLTLWVSWQLDGGAAAVNEAGRMRMQAYRMALAVAANDATGLASHVTEFERSLGVLRDGDPERPLFVPWDETVSAGFVQIESSWKAFRDSALHGGVALDRTLGERTATFVEQINGWVASIERQISRWTALLHLLQMAMMALAVLGTAALLYTGYMFVLEPVGQIKRAIEQIQQGDLGARVNTAGNDEFATLAAGFNGMAEHLQSMYRNLEGKVTEKTAQLEEKRVRLEALYGVTALVARATTLDTLAQGFVEQVADVAHADGIALRWSDEGNAKYVMLASRGLPEAMSEEEHCLMANQCHCGAPSVSGGARVIPIRSEHPARFPHCAVAGYQTIVCIPVRHHDQIRGEIDLFFYAQFELSAAEKSLLEALAAHLAAAMENLRLSALEREAAVAQERGFLARELHDSIAQSLAFLKMQVQLLRDAQASGDIPQIEQAVGEIDAGVRESYGDVRELLLHFRTRANLEEIEPALQTTLRKFEHQSGIRTEFSMQGHGIALAPDLQLQVLHVVQEALSNARKHSGATRVWLDVQQQPQWRFEVRDNGQGFERDDGRNDETHVGLRIMSERAERIGGTLEVFSTVNHGTSVILTLATDTYANANGNGNGNGTVMSPHDAPFVNTKLVA